MKLFIASLIALVGSTVAQECPADSAVGCNICPDSVVKSAAATATWEIVPGEEQETASCEEWWVFACKIFDGDCAALQAGVADCCEPGNAAEAEAPVLTSEDSCPDETGCDICPDGPVIDDSLVVTSATETATCGEWFMVGCIFTEPDACDGLRAAAADCCADAAADVTDEETEAPTGTEPPIDPPVGPPSDPPIDPPTDPPIQSPTDPPTVAPTDFEAPTAEPSQGGPATMLPTTPVTPFNNLVMEMAGVKPLDTNSQQTWTDEYVQWTKDFYDNNKGYGVTFVQTVVEMTNQDPPLSRRLSTRDLQQTDPEPSKLKVTYSQSIYYSTTPDTNMGASEVVLQPFANADRREAFTNRLKTSGDDAFANIIGVSEIEQEITLVPSTIISRPPTRSPTEESSSFSKHKSALMGILLAIAGVLIL